jgi:CBS domain-containing protein
MQVKDIMTPHAMCCGPDTLLPDVARLMCDQDCGAIPVLDGQQRPIGIVTDRDIACRAVATGRDVVEMEAREIMSQPVRTVSPDATVEQACEILEQHLLRRVLVVDSGGRCCGIVAQADVARFAPRREAADVVRKVSQSSRRPASAQA